MRKVLLLGYFGAGNFGDDALLCDWLVRWKPFLQKHNLIADVLAHSSSVIEGFVEAPQLASVLEQVVTCAEALKTAPANYTALIAPGGSLLQDASSLRSLLFYLWIIHRFTNANRPVYLLNQGFGPFNSWLAKRLTPRILTRCRFIACRDADSFAWACAPGRLAQHPELHAAADPILAARIAADKASVTQWELPGKYVLVLPRPTSDLPTPLDPTTEADALAALLHTTFDLTGLPVLLLPLHPAHDTQFACAVAAAVPGARVLPPLASPLHAGTAVWTALGAAELVISYRLHGIIAAAAHGVPSFGVAYDPKVVSCCQGLGLPYCFPASVHEQAARADVARLWADRVEVRQVLSELGAQQLGRLAAVERRYEEVWEKDCT